MQADEQPESKAETTIDLKVAEALERFGGLAGTPQIVLFDLLRFDRPYSYRRR